MTTKKILMIIGLVFAVLSPAAAEKKTGARFLDLGVGARELALGGGGAAISNDVNAIYWNPAGLTRFKEKQIGITHAEWLLGSEYDYVGFAVPNDQFTLGVNGIFFSQPDQEGRDENRGRTGNFSTSDLSLGVGGAMSFKNGFSMGSSLKYVESRIASYHARGLAIDIGGQFGLNNRGKTHFGLAARNLGGSLGYTDERAPLPTTIAVGASHSFLRDMLTTSEFRYNLADKTPHFVIGTEYTAIGPLSLRIGHLSNLSNSIGTDRDKKFLSIYGLVGGLGLTFSALTLDYAFTPFGQLGDVHRVSIVSRFGATVATAKPEFVRESPAPRTIISIGQTDSLTPLRTTLITYTVKEGDTLQTISKHFYGRETLWRQILFHNPTITNATQLIPGQKLFIPKSGN